MTDRSKNADLCQIRVLCIDDDPDVSHAISLSLRNSGVEVLRAFHGMQGFWLAMSEKPDLIITDIAMPNGTGDYIVECLKRNSDTSHLPVIVLTGSRDQDLERKMLALGVDKLLRKPLKLTELQSAIRSLVAEPAFS